MVDLNKYKYAVSWSEKDQEHVGLCEEFPSLSHLAPDDVEALNGIKALVAAVVEEMGAKAPEPLSQKRYSGQFLVRISSTLHGELVRVARIEKLSLNALVAEHLSRAVGGGEVRIHGRKREGAGLTKVQKTTRGPRAKSQPKVQQRA